MDTGYVVDLTLGTFFQFIIFMYDKAVYGLFSYRIS